MDQRIEAFADILVKYSVQVDPGDKVLIAGSTLAEPLIKAIYQKVLEAGGHSFLNVGFPGMDEIFYKFANNDQLSYTCPVRKMINETFDCLIKIGAPHNNHELSGVDLAKMQTTSKAYGVLRQIISERSEKWSTKEAKKGQARWVVTAYPTMAAAMDAGMGLMGYEDFLYKAVGALRSDPVAYWNALSERQDKIVGWLNNKKHLRITGRNCELECSVDGRKWINCDGRLNLPDGEIFTGPVENSLNGWIKFTYPTIYSGREIEGVRLVFKEGKVTEASADKEEAFLLSTIDTDQFSRYVGELAIGTNDNITRFTKSILFDEKIAKSIHLALGDGFPETGSKNQSAIHWDMVCDMADGGEVYADGELFYKDGDFLI